MAIKSSNREHRKYGDVVITGNHKFPLFNITSGASVTFDGVSFSKGWVIGDGGCLSVMDGSSAEVRGGLFESCTSRVECDCHGYASHGKCPYVFGLRTRGF